MKSIHVIFVLLLVIGLALVTSPVQATYAADRPLSLVETGIVHGEVIESIGTSVYQGAIQTNGTYTVDFPLSIPNGSTIRSARLSTYWTWSKQGSNGTLPDLGMTLNGMPLTMEKRYYDSKGSGTYDYPYGLDSYNVTGKINASGTYRAILTNLGAGKEISLYGIGLMLIIETPEGQNRQYWIHEGADLLYNTTTTTADQATTTVSYENVPAQSSISASGLLTIIAGADKGDRNKNELFFNNQPLGSVDAPNNTQQIAITQTDVLPFLHEGSNQLAIQDRGDSMMPGTVVLTVDLVPHSTIVPVYPLTAFPRDNDGDGIFEDLNGNGHLDYNDVVIFFNSMDWIADNEPVSAFDVNKNSRIDFNDIVTLFNRL